MSLVTLSSCSNPIVLWEAPVEYHGTVLERFYTDSGARVQPLDGALVVSSDGRYRTTTDKAGEWMLAVGNAPRHQGFWCTQVGYDSGYVEFDRNDVKYRGGSRSVLVAPSILEVPSDVKIDVDSMRNDTLWYRVLATTSPSQLFVTIFFYDTAETDESRIKKWSATLRTLTTVKARDCDGRPLVATGLDFVQPMFDANTLHACAAIGAPILYFTNAPDAENSNVMAVGGVGRLTALRAIKH